MFPTRSPDLHFLPGSLTGAQATFPLHCFGTYLMSLKPHLQAQWLPDTRACPQGSSQVPFSPLVIFHAHYCRKQMLRKRTLVGVLDTPSCLKTRFCRVVLAGHKFKISQPLSLKGSDDRCILACSQHMTFLKVNGIKQGVSYTLYQTYAWTLWQCFF